MSQYPQEDRRCYSRLRYPDVERPTVRFNDRDFPVAEISEKGAKILLPSGCSVCLDASFSAVVNFGGSENIDIEGIVVRCDEEGMVVKLSKGVDAEYIRAEMSRIHQKYPEFSAKFVSNATDESH